MSFIVVIPARYESTRLPGKPLLDIAGKPMIQHVYERALLSNADEVIIATDDQRIVDVINGFNGKVVLTSKEHESGTDRLQEVAQTLKLSDQQIVVNVQGDEPLIPPEVINQVARNLAINTHSAISTLVEPIDDIETIFDPNAVKVTMDKQGQVLYFSRAPLPWCRDDWSGEGKTLPASVNFYRHIGIYGYRVHLLHDFVTWPVSMLEQAEKLEQLRAMENGIRIHAEQAIEAIPAGVDTEQDLKKVRDILDAK
ncbi:MAG: 3-deoxy-manno-octulosonate cytidylyltransferase (CMP-KDO synthetase) [Pseudohongiellaceae bacterium]|jgi:3-deoxy-manno-octulosonate cytidylyltransferase (CMP-KDO synthetase)